MKAGRESKEAPRDIGRPKPIATAVLSVVGQRESNELRPSVILVGLQGEGDEVESRVGPWTPCMACRKIRVEAFCLSSTLEREAVEELNDRGVWFRVVLLREGIGVEVDVDGNAGEVDGCKELWTTVGEDGLGLAGGGGVWNWGEGEERSRGRNDNA